MRGFRPALVLALATSMVASTVVAQSPDAPPSPNATPIAPASPVPNAERPLTHGELLAYRGELALDDDISTTVIADAWIRRLPGARSAAPGARGAAVGTLPREAAYPDEPAVLAVKAVRERYTRGWDIRGLSAFHVTNDGLTLRGSVETPAGSYRTPLTPEAMALADELPRGALIVVRGALTRLIPEEPCPKLPRELNRRRFGGGSPFSTCPVAWLTAEPVTATAADDPLVPQQFGIRVQHGAADYFWRRIGQPQPDAWTYLLRHIADPREDGEPSLGWEVVGRVDPLTIPADAADVEVATRPAGLDWRPVLGRQPPSDTSGLRSYDDAVGTISWSGGFASVHQGRDRVLAVWVSPDGERWQSTALPSGIGYVNALLRLGDGLAIIADAVNGGDGKGTWRFDVWRSDDGMAWRQVRRHLVRSPFVLAPEDRREPYYRQVQGFWSTGDTIVAHETYSTYRCCGSGGWSVVSAPRDGEPITYAWTSRDGRSWQRDRVRGLHVAGGWFYSDAVHEEDDGLYAIAGGPSFAIDRSRDGVHWQQVGRVPEGLDFFTPTVFERTDDGFVLGGMLEEPRGPDESWEEEAVLWHSPDADRWTETARPGPGWLDSIGSAADVVVLSGFVPDEPHDRSWLRTSTDGGRTWSARGSWTSDEEWCLREVTGGRDRLVLDAACPPVHAASKYLATVDMAPVSEPTMAPVTVVRAPREAVECESGPVDHSSGRGIGGTDDPEATMERMARSGGVVPVTGYEVLERDDAAVLYGYRNSDAVKVAIRVLRDGERWRPDGIARCPLAEFGPEAEMGDGTVLWADADGRTIQERSGFQACGWPGVRLIYLTERGQPERLRDTRVFVQDPEGDLRDQWRARYLRGIELPADAAFSGYVLDGAELWLAADGDAAFVVRGEQVEQWPRVPAGVDCA